MDTSSIPGNVEGKQIPLKSSLFHRSSAERRLPQYALVFAQPAVLRGRCS